MKRTNLSLLCLIAFSSLFAGGLAHADGPCRSVAMRIANVMFQMNHPEHSGAGGKAYAVSSKFMGVDHAEGIVTTWEVSFSGAAGVALTEGPYEVKVSGDDASAVGCSVVSASISEN